MTQLPRRLFLGAASAALVAGCAGPRVAARSEYDPLEGGIGGTGIVGILSDFGSLLVAGLKVETRGRTRVASPLGSLSLGDLAIGQSLTIEAEARQGGIFATRVTTAPQLIGHVDRARHGGAFSVNGVDVMAEAGLVGIAKRPERGARVEIHGAWRGARVSASRIAPVSDGPDLVSGTVGSSRIGSVRVQGGTLPEKGSFATAVGRFAGGGLRADDLLEGRFTGGLDQLAVEGFLEPDATAPGLRVAGLGHSFDAAVRLQPFQRLRAAYFGPYEGKFAARQALVLPESFTQRRSLIRATVADPDPAHFKPTR